MKGHVAKKNGRYYPVISMKDAGTGKWKRKWLSGHKSKRSAYNACAEAVAQANKGWFTVPGRETVAELCRNYLTTTARIRVRPITLQSYRQMLENHLISRLGAKPAAALTPDDLNCAMTDMAALGRSATTIRYFHRIVHRLLDDAVRKQKLARNVADLADPPRAQRYEAKVWDELELNHFLESVASSEYADYYELFATIALTGIRRGEALGLKWSDVDLNSDSPKLHIRRAVYKLDNGEWQFKLPKTERSFRVIAMPRALMLRLRRFREQREASSEWACQPVVADDFIFVRLDGTLPDPRYVSKTFHRLAGLAGLKQIRLHDLRHSYTTIQRKSGQPIEVVSKVLGHASELVTLKVYSHWEGESRAPADTMDQMLEKHRKIKTEEHSLEKC